MPRLPIAGMLRARLVLFAAAGMMAAPVAAQEAVEPPKDAAPLSAADLLVLYGGKTWQWGEGGAYFDREGRKFLARTVSDEGETTAEGKWKITDSGRLCFTAKWGTDVAPTESCFEHLTSDGDIYQRRLPDGGWYIFKHAKTEPADEYSKLVRKDLVSVASTTN